MNLRVFALGTCLAALSFRAATAQRSERSWKTTARVQGEFRYDDNPFLLTSGHKARLEQRDAADLASGQFTDMERASDLIPTPSLEVGMEGPGFAGRTLALRAEGAYEANLENARRRHAELAVSLQQALPRSGRVRLEADWRPQYFSKNYLADAVDGDGDGSISDAERRYAPGTSHDVDLSLDYRHRLVKQTKRRAVGVTAQVQVGYSDRGYDAPFSGRSRNGPGAGVGVDVELGDRWDVALDYSYVSLGGDAVREVLILDENAFGQDLNGNGTATDVDARAFELVDRSRREHDIEVVVHGDLSRRLTGEIGYGRRFRRFTSVQPYDVVDRGRRDTRDELLIELDVRLASGLHLALGGRHAVQRTNRAGDPGSTGEVADYTRNVAFAGVQYRF